VRTVGVEEELLLVDAEGRPRSVAGRILENIADTDGEAVDDGTGGSLTQEFKQQQLETDTAPHERMSALESEIRGWRAKAITAARDVGARVVASGTSPLPVEPARVRDPRFEQMAELVGLTADEQMSCACHVHVAIDSDDEGVGVLDRIRVWLPILLAISANSPFWQGKDTLYASFRSQVIVRWCAVGPNDVLGSAEAYHDLVDAMIASGVLLDEQMFYFDARLSSHAPTVEIRVADVCLDVEDAVLLAALCRALVDTAARAWKTGEPPPDVPTPLVRIATWQAGRRGIEADLLSPETYRPVPARTAIRQLVDHVAPALRENADEELVERLLRTLWERGNGAMRQRAILEKTGQLSDVVADLARVTAGQGD
jgi:carboxylate-amine ligase